MGRRRVTAYLGGRVHEVELQQVLDAERLEEEDDVGEVRPLDLGHRRHQQLLLVLPVRVEPVALAARARGHGGVGRRSGTHAQTQHGLGKERAIFPSNSRRFSLTVIF